MPATGEIFKCVMRSLVRGQEEQNVLHMRGLTGSETAAIVAAEMNAHWWALIAPLQTGNCTYIGCIVTQMTPVLGDRAVAPNLSGTNNGSAGSNYAPQVLSVVCTLRTGVAGKIHRGRIYIGAMNLSDEIDDILTSTGISKYQTFASGVMTRWGPTGGSTTVQLGIYSRVLGGVSPYTVAGWQVVQQIQPQAIIKTQRRRGLGVGI